MDKQIDRLLEGAIKQKVFPGAVLLCSKQKRIVYHKSHGYADLYDGSLMKNNTIFDLASLTKPFATALIVARMVENNVLDLDDEIKEYLPDFQPLPIGKITIDMLMRHTSGLPAYKEYYKTVAGLDNPRDKLRQMLLDECLVSKPGKIQTYSDLGFMILSWLVEEITRARFDRLFKNYVSNPLGLERLFFIQLEEGKPSLDAEIINQIAATQKCPWRGKLLKGEVDDDNTWAVGGIEGHAGLFGDAVSIHCICTELLDALNGKENRLVSPEVFSRFTTPQKKFDMIAGFDTPSKTKSSAGKYFSRRSIGHLGYTGTSFWIDPEAELIVIFLTNRVHPSRQNESIKKFRPKLHDLIHSTLA